jgi:cell division protein ZapA
MDMMTTGKIRVNIFGSEYSLVADEQNEHVKEIALYVDQKMREIDRSQNVNSNLKVAILAALNIAEELREERKYRERLLDQLNEESRKMNRLLVEMLEG